MTDWTRTLAAWTPAPETVLDDEHLLEYVTGEAFARLDRILLAEGAVDLGARHLQIAENHAYDWPGMEGPRFVLLAETRAIILRHPNPFPEIRPFRRKKLEPDDVRSELWLLVLTVLVVTSWAATAAYALRGGPRLEQPVRAGETSEPVIFTGDTGP